MHVGQSHAAAPRRGPTGLAPCPALFLLRLAGASFFDRSPALASPPLPRSRLARLASPTVPPCPAPRDASAPPVASPAHRPWPRRTLTPLDPGDILHRGGSSHRDCDLVANVSAARNGLSQEGKTALTSVASERVLVVPTAVFHRLGYFQGFCGEVERYLGELLRPEHLSYRPRDEVEHDPSFKQLIPYVVFCHTDAAGCLRLFQYTRGQGQGEARLRAKRSVGIGGHISAEDGGLDGSADPYTQGMRRELEEEVILDSPYTSRCVGFINDDQTDVGRVHLGLVHRIDVERPAVYPREPEIMAAGFTPVAALLAELSAFETWSQICLRALFGGEGAQAAAG